MMVSVSIKFHSVTRRLLHAKIFRNTGVLTLLCAFILNIAAWGVQTYDFLSQTTVAEVAITVKTIETCHHHPHGCPKECLCPKTLVTIGEESGTPAENSGTLHEPAWVTCTEQGPESLTPSFAVFIPESICILPVFKATVFHMVDGVNFIPDTFQKPPQKIPIS